MNMPNPIVSRAQQGASLIVVLILLLVMTLLGLAVLRSTLMEERMSSNLLDRSIAFQAAESALRQGEAIAAAQPVIPAAGCTAGVCALPDASVADRWLGNVGWVNGATVPDLGGTPQYMVESMGDAPTWPGCDLVDEVNRSPLCMRPRYRISARSVEAGRSQVVLQTNFIAQ